MITKANHDYFIKEKMLTDLVDHDIITYFYSHLSTPEEKQEQRGAATPLIKIRKGVE